MRNQDKPKSARRREFMKLMGFSGAAGVAAAAAVVTKRPAEAADQRPESKGYRETAHVKKFYDLARF
jgi:hypothetical protein